MLCPRGQTLLASGGFIMCFYICVHYVAKKECKLIPPFGIGEEVSVCLRVHVHRSTQYCDARNIPNS